MTKSCYKINKEVALYLGWRQRVTEDALWNSPDKKDMDLYDHSPNFCGEWQHAGPLFALLTGEDKMHITRACQLIINQLKNCTAESWDDIIKEAIARAYRAALMKTKERQDSV